MFPIVIAIAAGVGVAALVAGVAMMFRGTTDDTVEDRLEMLAGTKSRQERALMEAEQSLLHGSMDEVPGQIEQFLLRLFNVRLLIEQANVNITVPKFFGLCGALAAAGALICVVAKWNPLYIWIPLLSLPLGFLPIMWLLMARKRRWNAFGKQLPEALELMARGLRAGHSLQAGFQLVGDEMNDPIGTEFTRVFEEQNLGIALEEALESMTERIPNLDLRFFATAIVLQRQTGGDLAEILDKIGHLIRERFKIFGQIQALTGEGRLSGVVLMALPPVLFLVMLKINYEYSMTLFEDPLGVKMLAFAVVLQIIGALVIRKIVNIKV